jgi:transposase
MEVGKRVSGEASKELHLLLGDRLAMLGLSDIADVVTHTNRTVMLSVSRRILRIHRGYAFAPDRVLKAIVRFLNPRVPRALRRAAEREFLGFPAEVHAPSPPRSERRERARPGDLLLLHQLEASHRRLNAEHFGGALGEIPIRLSGRMRTRLGELAADLRTGRPTRITMSHRHLARHSWTEVEHTLLHEMVHQWQAETGLRIDHGPTFRKKAREVGALPQAKRKVAPAESASAEGRSVADPARYPDILIARTECDAGRTLGNDLAMALKLPYDEQISPY